MQLRNPADFLDFLTKTQLHDVHNRKRYEYIL